MCVCVCMYKQVLVLNDSQGLIYHKTPTNQPTRNQSAQLYSRGMNMDSCISQRALAQSETQTVSSKFWIQVANFISHDDKAFVQ